MQTAFFMASNSGGGFYSLYDEFPGDKVFLHIIKGGPGTGKSGFMRRIANKAQEQGMDTELILCSGDPDSLDGLYIPQLKQAWVDGTAPHVREPRVFGADSDYVNLGIFCNLPLSKSAAAQAREINQHYKALYASAYSYLKAEAAVAGAYETEPLSSEYLEQMENIISDILSAERSRLKKGEARHCRRFISAISCRGKVRLDDTVNKLCKQYYFFEDALQAHQLLTLVARQAAKAKFDAILCPEPLRPERLEALLLPEAGICFCAAEPERGIKGMRISFGDELKKSESRQHENPIKEKLRRQATELLAQAKELHDELEAVYRPNMDFAALTAYTDEYIEKLFA